MSPHLQTSEWSRSDPVRRSLCFSAPIFSAAGFVRPRGRRGVRFGWALSSRQAFHHSSASPGATSSAGLAHRKESLQPEQTLLALNAPGNGMHGQVCSPPGSARRTRLTHPASSSAERAPHWCLAGRSRGREFADLGLRRTLPELGPARRANERTPRRARLPPRALIGPSARETGLAGSGQRRPRVPGAGGSGARAPRRPPPLPAAVSLPPSSSLPASLPHSRLRPRAGGAPHCTLRGRRSDRGMGQRAAAGGRNPHAARVSRGGLPGRAQKDTGLVPAAQTNAEPGPRGSGLVLEAARC